MSLVCRPTPSFVSTTEASNAQNNFCLGWHVLTFGALVLLPEGAYLGTAKHDSVVSVQKNYCYILCAQWKSGNEMTA